MDIVVTGYAGLEGSIAVYNAPACFSKLKERYSESFFAVFKNTDIIFEASQSKICTETEKSEGECGKADEINTAGAELDSRGWLRTEAEAGFLLLYGGF